MSRKGQRRQRTRKHPVYKPPKAKEKKAKIVFDSRGVPYISKDGQIKRIPLPETGDKE